MAKGAYLGAIPAPGRGGPSIETGRYGGRSIAARRGGATASEVLRTTLAGAGLRLTRQRAAVYDHLLRAAHHPTAEEVHRGVRETVPSIGLATVYKALEALVAIGLASRLTDADGPARYDGRPDLHYHLRCLRSGVVEDIETAYDPDLIARIDPGLGPRLRRRGFRVTGYRLELFGYYEGAAAPEAGGDEIP